MTSMRMRILDFGPSQQGSCELLYFMGPKGLMPET